MSCLNPHPYTLKPSGCARGTLMLWLPLCLRIVQLDLLAATSRCHAVLLLGGRLNVLLL